jgi:transcriptional regulator with XRE-family HTH domain
MEPSRALSIRPEWIQAILHLGKRTEERDWPEGYAGLSVARRLVGATIYLHASLGDRAAYEACGLEIPPWSEAVRGALVATAKLEAVVDRDDPRVDRWDDGSRVALILGDVRPLAEPIPMSEKPGLFLVKRSASTPHGREKEKQPAASPPEEPDPELVVREVSRRIREIRAQRGLTEEHLAEHLKVSLRAYHSIERGRNLNIKRLTRIATALGARLSDLFVTPALQDPPHRRPSRRGALAAGRGSAEARDAQSQHDGVRDRVGDVARSDGAEALPPAARRPRRRRAPSLGPAGKR